MKQLLSGLLAATAISSDVLLRAVVSVNVSTASGSAASSSAAASGSNREEVGETREPPVAPEEAGFPASQSASSVSAAPALDSKRRRFRRKQAPPKTDEKQVGNGGPSKELCGICYEKFPVSDLERYFDACGAGDICDPGHKFCSECARTLKEEPRAKNAHCPFCDRTAEGERPDHTCAVCNNEGGPHERPRREDGTTGGTTGLTPDEVRPRVGCWGCGRLRRSPDGDRGREQERPDEDEDGDRRVIITRYMMDSLLFTTLLPEDASDAFIVHGRDMTQAERAFVENMNRSDARGEVWAQQYPWRSTAFADVVPPRLRTDPLTLSRVMAMAYNGGRRRRTNITFTRDDWNRLPEGLRESVNLTALAIYTGVLTHADIPEALQRNVNEYPRLRQTFAWLANRRRPMPRCFRGFLDRLPTSWW